jgi:hypothetical protein
MAARPGKNLSNNTANKTPPIIPAIAALDVVFFQKNPNKKTGNIAGEI